MMHARFAAVPAAPFGRPVAALAGLVARLWRTWRARARARATLRTLSALDDRMLRDIGLAREDIAALAGDPAATATLRERRRDRARW